MAAATAAAAAAALQLAQALQRHKLTRLLIFSSSEQPNGINKVALNCRRLRVVSIPGRSSSIWSFSHCRKLLGRTTARPAAAARSKRWPGTYSLQHPSLWGPTGHHQRCRPQQGGTRKIPFVCQQSKVVRFIAEAISHSRGGLVGERSLL